MLKMEKRSLKVQNTVVNFLKGSELKEDSSKLKVNDKGEYQIPIERLGRV